MRELYDTKHLLTDDEYLRFSKRALDARKARRNKRDLPNDPSIKRAFRAWFRSSLEVVRLTREIVKDTVERETKYGPRLGPPLLLA